MTFLFLIYRVLAYDYEQLQFIADLKTTVHDPSAIYFISSKFHRFFLKNVNPYEINTRLIRIGNVAQSPSPYPFIPNGYPNFNQNSIDAYGFTNALQAPHPAYGPFGPSQPSPTVYPMALPISKPNYPFSYNLVPSEYPSRTNQYSSIPSSFLPPTQLSPISSAYNPVTSFFKYRGSSPYAFERFESMNNRNEFPFQQLNIGETIPQSGSSYVNFNMDSSRLTDGAYYPTRFLRNSSKNSTNTFQH